MRRTFVETPLFRATARLLLSDDLLRALQLVLLDNPERGMVIRGTGGARKIRIALANAGKSGGARVIYLSVPHSERIYLLLAYDKHVADTISEAGRKVLARLVQQIKAEPLGSEPPDVP